MCHFMELGVRKGTYPKRSVVVVITPYAQMVWLKWCVEYVGRKKFHATTPILLAIATLDRFQGLQAQVICASLVSPTPGIIK